MSPQLNSEQQHIISQIENSLGHRSLFRKKGQSFYIYGGTGSGKTTAIETFAMNCKKPLLFMHFHDYLLDVTRLSVKIPIQKIAKLIAKNFKVLCFDEFFIESIADAKILHDIFRRLIKFGVTIVITSNFKPEDLYRNGFNRELVFPVFSDFLNKEMVVIPIQNKQDYRVFASSTQTQIGFITIEDFAEDFGINIAYSKEILQVDLNHNIEILGRFSSGGVIDYSLFRGNSSIKDYRYLARKFEHLHITNMQSFGRDNEDEAIRFRNFIDIIYMRSTILTWNGCDAELFPAFMLENIKFKRCNSRLKQMATKEYIGGRNLSFKREANISSAVFFENLVQQNQ